MSEQIENFLPVLINRISEKLTRSFSKAAGRYGLSVVESRVLRALEHSGPVRLLDLSESSGVDLSTLCRLIRRLERKNFVEMSFRGETRRADTIALAAQGALVLADLTWMAEAHERSLIEGIDAEEFAICKSVLNRVYANAGDAWLTAFPAVERDPLS